MIEDYLIVADRIRQELGDLERVVTRAERAIKAARNRPEDQDHEDVDGALLAELEWVVARAERAISAARHRAEDQDLYINSAALNLHDFYAGLERIFHQIATTVDGNLPTGRNGTVPCFNKCRPTYLTCVRPCYLLKQGKR